MYRMPLDTICCICLDTECNYLTDCCKNKIHKSCLVNWVVYKGEFNCPLCRNTETRLPINDLLNTPIVEYGLTNQDISKNLNKLLMSYNLFYNITIDIPQDDSFYCVPLNYYRIRIPLRFRTYRQCGFLLLILIVYLLLFFLMNIMYYIPKNTDYIDNTFINK